MTREKQGIGVLLALLLTRLAAMALVPLNDVTEARYGEMARRMLASGDWVTPMHAAGVPFLAKPPLWAWLSAASMGVFGVNEFAARLPTLLLALLTLALAAYLAFRRHGRGGALAAALVLGSAMGFFVVSGTVMTDGALAFSTTLILAAFWLAFRYQEQPWRWMFFAACGIGLLAKGPVALVIAGMPVFFWTLRRKEWKNLWARLPWIRGALLTLLIAAPWYILAEIRTPGFLRYFLIGENFSRFLDPGWNGDRYGFAHAWPYGMIWAFALACFLPWSLALPAALKNAKSVWKDDDGWMLFLALWAGTSLVFFTAAANIIWPYPLPALTGIALLFAELRLRAGRPVRPAIAAVTVLAGLAAVLGFTLRPGAFDHSAKAVIALWRAQAPAENSRLVLWSRDLEFSAAFYSRDRAEATFDPAAVSALSKNGTRDYIIASPDAAALLPPGVRKNFAEAGRVRNARGTRILLGEKKP